jgi:uncharacterized membrane protein
MNILLKHLAPKSLSLVALTVLSFGSVAHAQSSPLSVSQVDPVQAKQIASAPATTTSRNASTSTEAASALAEILNRAAAGEPIDDRLIASANSLSTTNAEDGNTVVIQQDGDNNKAAIDQKGRNNDATIVQKGDQNVSTIDQTGNNNVAEHVQIGNGLALEVTQNGDATVFITQSPQ